MNPLATCRHMLWWLCIYSSGDSIDKWLNRKRIIFGSSVVVMLILDLVASIAFLLNFISSDFSESLFAIMQILGAITNLNVIVVALIYRHKITNAINKLTEIYDANIMKERFTFLMMTNIRCEWAWSSLRKITIGTMGLFSILGITSIILSLANDDRTYFCYPARFLLPWEQHTYIGYVGDIIFECLVGAAFFICNGSFILFFISICLHLKAFSKMFQHSTLEMNRPDQNCNNKKFLAELIQFHMTIRSYFLDAIQLFSPFFLIQLMCTMSYLAIAVFQLDVKHHETGDQTGFGIVVPLLVCVAGTSNLFTCCFFGKMASNSFERMANFVYDVNWYSLSLEKQKYFILMLLHAQRSLYFHGYGIAVLNLETFCTLMNYVYTYYMVCKAVTKN